MRGRTPKRVNSITNRFTFHCLLTALITMTIEAKLIAVEGATEAEIKLKLPTVIGRSGEASLKVRTSVVSREHCRLYEQNGTLYVEDLNSSNGTFVNEERITGATPVETGDFLTIGPVTLEIVCKIDDRSVSHDPYSGDRSVLTEPAETDAESASNVHYKETLEGSFLGIDDSMPLRSGSRKSSENRGSSKSNPLQLDTHKNSKRSRDTKSDRNDQQIGLRKNDKKDTSQEQKDDALNDFLNNLNE